MVTAYLPFYLLLSGDVGDGRDVSHDDLWRFRFTGAALSYNDTKERYVIYVKL